MTDDYMAVSANLLGVLLSNTKFPDKQAVSDTLEVYISRHLPAMHGWLTTLTSGVTETLDELTTLSIAQSINLQLDDVLVNEERNNDLVCGCGCKVFVLDTEKTSWNHIVCTGCRRFYYSDETTNGEYIPYFACLTCGSNDYIQDDFAVCSQCSEAYVHDKVHGIFGKVNN
jgi:hypothetical protein